MAKSKKSSPKHQQEGYYASDEQGILKTKSEDDEEKAIIEGDEDEEVYTSKGREKLEEDDEIETWEEGFMEGASDAGQLGKDALTGEPLMDVEDVYELQFNGKMYRFVNEKNAKKFLEKQKVKK